MVERVGLGLDMRAASFIRGSGKENMAASSTTITGIKSTNAATTAGINSGLLAAAFLRLFEPIEET